MPIDFDEGRLLSAASGLNSTASVNLTPLDQNITVYVQFSQGVSSGAVTVDSAPVNTFSGKWHEHSKVVAASDQVTYVSLTGPAGAVRTLVSSSVTGGDVSTWVLTAD